MNKKVVGERFRVGRKLGSGSFGEVFAGSFQAHPRNLHLHRR